MARKYGHSDFDSREVTFAPIQPKMLNAIIVDADVRKRDRTGNNKAKIHPHISAIKIFIIVISYNCILFHFFITTHCHAKTRTTAIDIRVRRILSAPKAKCRYTIVAMRIDVMPVLSPYHRHFPVSFPCLLFITIWNGHSLIFIAWRRAWIL